MRSRDTYDVAIAGGGLAGLSLALQIRRQLPAATVLVVEQARFPLPEAAHKVGESTAEAGSYYLNQVVGLGDHLRTEHLPKLGLRFFMPANGNHRIEERFEVGARRLPPTPSFQIDRGRLENHLAERWAKEGDLLTGTTVRRIALGDRSAAHSLDLEGDSGAANIKARWLVDAAGRRGLLRTQERLHRRPAHAGSAAWFRLDRKLDLTSWATDQAWVDRIPDGGSRWLSTNHLMGPGYWVWLIPLAGDMTSIGIVTDERIHPLASYGDFDRLLAWLRRHEPQCHAAVEGARGGLMDFRSLRNFAFETSRVFAANRWAVTGEAAQFLDPFYSPGTDFIGIGNTLLTQLVERDLTGGSLWPHVDLCNDLYQTLYRNTSDVFRDIFPLFGNTQLMPVKVAWDFAVYWCSTAFLACQQRIGDFAFLRAVRADALRMGQLNESVQRLFRRWHERAPGSPRVGFHDFLGQPKWLEMNRELTARRMEFDAAQRYMADGRQFVEGLAGELVAAAGESAGNDPLLPPARPAEFLRVLFERTR